MVDRFLDLAGLGGDPGDPASASSTDSPNRVQREGQRTGVIRAQKQPVNVVDLFDTSAKGKDPNLEGLADDVAALDDSEDSDVDAQLGSSYAQFGICVSDPSTSVIASHIIMSVSRVTKLQTAEVNRTEVGPGRLGMASFIDGRLPQQQLATIMVIREDQSPPFPVKPRRCIHPRAPLLERRDTTATSGARDRDGSVREAYWQGQTAEVRVRLKQDHKVVYAGLVVGNEVVAITKPLSMYGSERRFFEEYELFRPGNSGIGEVIGYARVAVDVWPPGSLMPMEMDAGVGTDRDIGLYPIKTDIPEDPSAQRFSDESDQPLCAICDGIGRRSCSACNGHGVLVCKACDGMPPLPCGRCGGTGGLESGLEAIAGIRGGVLASSGATRCNHCWGSPLSCQSCFGMGALRCASCTGSGWFPCSCGAKTSSMWV
eukprot:TRINITY_DN44118_c0_g1_i1.p1 TRINITY_DN44118_c0_g1~~TRINITY_DN44118_c0_g1_i1.p1  ORF type:complete len:429 (-),score=61.59 TRINITY_DN44118_c0_g1_i1:18-1304(-)